MLMCFECVKWFLENIKHDLVIKCVVGIERVNNV